KGTTYSAGRNDALMYHQSAQNRIGINRARLDSRTNWRFRLAIEDGDIVLPRTMRLADVRWEWIPVGIPWLDPLKEAKAESEQIANRTNSRQRICKSRGRDWREVARELAEERAWLDENGLSDPVRTDDTPETPENAESEDE
ncbi:MAG: hypothetical protein AAF078_01855, partial [Planctomycetota bacterium]